MLPLELRRRWHAAHLADGPLRDLYRHPFPSAAETLDSMELLALDLETTGLDHRQGHIISVGWVVVARRQVLLGSGEHHLVRPERAIDASSVAIHAITDDMAAEGEPLCEVLPRVLQALRGRVLLAHNAIIERRFLDQACRSCFGGPFFTPAIDTLQLALRRLRRQDRQPRGGELRLAALREQYGLPRYKAHNALSDAVATGELFLAQLAHWSNGERVQLKQLLG